MRRVALTVVIPTRDGSALRSILDDLGPRIDAVDGEIVVVDGRGSSTGEATEPSSGVVRWIGHRDDDLFVLRAIGVAAARGAIVAIGEDHVVPRADWPLAVLRAHAEHPDAPGVSGCLANGTTHTCSGRANFLAFAAPFSVEMADTPAQRTPPSSTISIKRGALTSVIGRPGALEAQLLPELFERGALVRDNRIVVGHFQDHGIVWSVKNAFWSARASYGSASRYHTPQHRRRVARWALTHVAPGLWREAKAAAERLDTRSYDLGVVAVIASAAGLGATVGSLRGPGRSPSRVS